MDATVSRMVALWMANLLNTFFLLIQPENNCLLAIKLEKLEEKVGRGIPFVQVDVVLPATKAH